MNLLFTSLFALMLPVATAASPAPFGPAPGISGLGPMDTCNEIPFAPVNSPDPAHGVSQQFINIHKHASGRDPSLGCSLSLIGPDLVLTAGHCYGPKKKAAVFHHEDGTPDTRSRWFPIKEFVFRIGHAMVADSAVYRLAENAGDVFGWREIEFSDFGVGESIVIFQHPGRQPKKYCGGPLNLVIREGDNHPLLPPGYVAYQCSTGTGSSGSAVINRQGRLLAVHTGAGCNYEGLWNNLGFSLQQVAEKYPEFRSMLPPPLNLADGAHIRIESGADPGAYLDTGLNLVPEERAATWTVKRFDNGTIGLYSEGGGWMTWEGESGTPGISPGDDPSGIGYMWLGLRKKNGHVYLRTSPQGYPRWLEPREGGLEAHSAEKATHGWIFHDMGL